MVELKDHQQWEMESKLQFHSYLMLMEHVCIFESSQLEGLYARDLLYFPEFWEPL